MTEACREESNDFNSTTNLLTAIDTIEPFVPIDGSPSLLIELTSRLASLQNRYQGAPDPRLSKIRGDVMSSAVKYCSDRSSRMQLWLETILRLLCVHQKLIQQPKCSQVTLSRLVLTLSLLLADPHHEFPVVLSCQLFDTVSLISDFISSETRVHCIQVLRHHHRISDCRLEFLLGFAAHDGADSLAVVIPPKPTLPGSRAVVEPRILQFPLRRWEMVQDATPLVGENDTSLSLTLFGTRKAVF